MFNWILKPFLCLALGMSQLVIEFAGGASTDAVNFGYIPHISDIPKKSISVNITPESVPALRQTIISTISAYSSELGIGEYGSGYTVSLFSDKSIEFYQSHSSGNDGSWRTPANSITLNVVNKIDITHDITTPTTAPIIYINGVLQTLTTTSTPTGSVSSEVGSSLVIGNIKSVNNDYNKAFDGKIKDVRIYNRILSAAEVTTLYNGGTPDMDLVTDGLQFQAFVVPTFRLSSFVDATLTSSMKVRDRIYGVVGTPHGAPVGRTP